jgi:RNA polymerase sigma-70 factor (ECF subfamily)
MSEPDEWLMQQVAQGSSRHLETLIRRYSQPILTFATRMLGSVHRGEEAFQETFLSVFVRRSTYKYPRFFRPWLFRIAHNQCRELMRYKDFLAGRYVAEPDPQRLDPSRAAPGFSGPVEVAIAAETSTLVERAVACLPAQQRAILVLRVWNAMSYTEIAVTLEIAEATARSTMHDALASLRRYLEPRLRA